MKEDVLEKQPADGAETDHQVKDLQGTKKLIKIASLVAIDAECNATNGISGVIGDRYLYCHNPIFRRIRDTAIHAGCSFSAADSRLLRNYLSLPLFSLGEILEKRTIPYLENTLTLQEILRQNADIAVPVQLLLRNLRPNYLLHEASHFVGEQEIRNETWEFCESSRQRFVITSIVVEAFANTIERLASSDNCALIHAIFFHLNSYMDYDPARWTIANQGLRVFGLHAAFRLAFLSYLLANISDDKVTTATADRIVDLVWERPLCQDERKLLLQLLGSGYRINPRFRDETSRAYFRWHGCETEFAALQVNSLIMSDRPTEAILRTMARFARIALPEVSMPVPALSA